ncbi:MAG: DJ-1/PfpI family protein [Thermoplasmatota archaeon]
MDVAASKLEKIEGEHGYALMRTRPVDSVRAEDDDLLVIPGGSPDGAPATMRKLKHAQEIARSFMTNDKSVASICHGPYTLVSADLVRGRRLTSYGHDGVPEEIKAAGGTRGDAEVVVDRNLVTSRWPVDLPAFMRETMMLVDAKAQR